MVGVDIHPVERDEVLEVLAQVDEQQPKFVSFDVIIPREPRSCWPLLHLLLVRVLGRLEGAHQSRLCGVERIEAKHVAHGFVNLCERQHAVRVDIETFEAAQRTKCTTSAAQILWWFGRALEDGAHCSVPCSALQHSQVSTTQCGCRILADRETSSELRPVNVVCARSQVGP